MTGEWVTLAHLTRARGIRGELSAEPLAVGPERFASLEQVHLRDASGALRPFVIEHVWEHKGQLIFKFRGVDDRNAAEALERCAVCIPDAERPPLPPGEYYHSDLEGCRMEDPSGRLLGNVTRVVPTGGADVLELDSGVLVPLNRAICTTIDVQARRIVAELPEGLEELYRS